MSTKVIAPPLGLINPKNLAVDEKLLFSIHYEMFPEDTVQVYKKNLYLVIHTTYWSKLNKVWRSTQEEFPLESLPWIVDKFVNGFLRDNSIGTLSDFDRSLSKEFDGELIGINVMGNCCAKNLPGFNIWNANRSNYISNRPLQQWDIPRYILLDQGY